VDDWRGAGSMPADGGTCTALQLSLFSNMQPLLTKYSS